MSYYKVKFWNTFVMQNIMATNLDLVSSGNSRTKSSIGQKFINAEWNTQPTIFRVREC